MPAKKPTSSKPAHDVLRIRGAREHNLKNVSIDLPKNQLVVITGLSGSGKSSLAFDTIYAEGQRRYAESLSAYARQFMEMRDKPDVDEIQGLSPTVAIDQRAGANNPRSTVGTVTEVYDLLRLLFSRIGIQQCPFCQLPVKRYTPGEIVEELRALARKESDLYVLAPLFDGVVMKPRELLQRLERTGCEAVRANGVLMPLKQFAKVANASTRYVIELVVMHITDVKRQDISGAVDSALEFGNGTLLLVDTNEGDEKSYSTKARCIQCNRTFDQVEPRSFSFNSPYGACPRCTGLGITLEVDADLVIPNPRLTLAEGAIQPWTRITGSNDKYHKLLEAVARDCGFSVDVAVQDLPKPVMDIVFYGTDGKTHLIEGKPVVFEGVVPNLTQRHAETDSDYVRKEIEQYMREQVCPICTGKRLKQEALFVKVWEQSIADIVQFSIDECVLFFTQKGKGSGLSRGNEAIAQPIIKEMLVRLCDLAQVGLGYVQLDRSVASLSGGEAQRVRLSTQLSTGLIGVIYVLDEPSIGLHPADNQKLIDTLKELRDLGNTVIVVEHDAAMMNAADYLVDVGPGAGKHGGNIIGQGTLAQFKKLHTSTAQYLTGADEISAPKKYRKGSGNTVVVQGATGFNLKNIDAAFPLGTLICVTGVSGSGKSTLVIDILGRALARHFYRAKDEPGAHKSIKGLSFIDKVIAIDQSPIGRTPRSNPATYTGVFTLIRDTFTEVQEARARGYDAGKFSFNVKGGGRCEACAGEGYVRIPMQFLSDVFVECEACEGKRYNQEALEIHYRGKTIADVLEMTVEEARQFFSDTPAIVEKLRLLEEVGLGYVSLGQPATTLSGGEAQ
ncbi:MAG: excinuclease ABC subunit UvrA, partial [Patescibacteria group bacterium]